MYYLDTAEDIVSLFSYSLWKDWSAAAKDWKDWTAATKDQKIEVLPQKDQVIVWCKRWRHWRVTVPVTDSENFLWHIDVLP